jgi:diguanylate cyclase (GGDEF)-like protein/PAS domain S-box-containing protein
VILAALDARILYVNRAFEEMTGYVREEAVGRTPALLKSGQQSHDFYQSLWNTLRAGRHFTGVLLNRRKTGELFHEEKSIWPLVNAQGGVTHYVSIGRDVSRRVASIEHLVHAATHDSLTDLPNRTLFMDRLEQALRHAKRSGERLLVALLDVDQFKTVNDSLGHQTGDALLRGIAVRLRQSVREEDTVARLGGDEFAMVLPGVLNAESAQRILAKIIESFTAPIAVEHFMLRSSVSLGGCFWSGPPWEQEVLLELADQAMYRVKRSGGNGFLLKGPTPDALAGDFERRRMFRLGENRATSAI